jgi:cytosine/adenosine deaminase-related metal-dependent hydrolase
MIVTNVLAFTNDFANPLVDDALVRFENGEITYVGPRREYSIQEDEEVVDGEKGLLLPAFCNAHMSIYSSVSSYPLKIIKGYENGAGYFSNLLKSGYSKTNEKIAKVSAELAVLKALKSGTVSFSGPIFDCPEVDAEFYRELARRYGVNIAVGPVVVKESIESIIERWHEVPRDSNFCPLIYVSELATYDEEDLMKLRDLYSKGINLNLFIFDMKQENDLCLSRWGESLIERLLKNGILVPECGIIYGGNLSETDMDIISNRRIFVTKSIRSEMYAGTFQPNIADLLGRGMHVSIGTGFMGTELIEEAREIVLSERYHKHYDNFVIDYEIRKTLYDNNYKLAQRFFGKRTVVIKEGYSADLLLAKPVLDFERLDPELPTVLQLILKISCESNYEKVWNTGELILDKGFPQRISRKELKDLSRDIKNLEL